MKQVPLLLISSALVLCLLGQAGKCQDSQETSKEQSKWAILIFDKTGETDSLTSCPKAKDPHVSYFSKPVWQTRLIDSSTVGKSPGLIACLEKHLYKLDVVSKKAHMRKHCQGHLFHCEYAVDWLVAKPCSGGKSVCLWKRLPDDLVGFTYSIEKFCACPQSPVDRWEHQYHSKLAVTSLIEDRISIDHEVDWENGVGAHPEAWRTWETYKIHGLKISLQKHFPRRVWLSGRKIIERAGGESEDYAFPTESDLSAPLSFSEVLIVPSGGGFRYQLGLPCKYDPGYSTHYKLEVPVTQAVSEQGNKLLSEFIHCHRQLLPWHKLDFYTLSPDGKSLVYSLARRLYWMDVSSARGRFVGPIRAVQGWQWVDEELLTPTEQGQFAAASEASAKGLSQWLISPKDGSIGPINAKTSEVDLIRIFGRSNVSRGDVSIEGAGEKGTILYQGNKQKEINISWKDRSRFRNPATVFVASNATNLVPEMSPVWRLEHDITIGTTLKELEKLNRRPFQLSGITHGACSGSEIISWQGGQLEKELNGRVKVSLMLTATEEKRKRVTSAEWDHVSHDSDVYSSTDEIMQKLDPVVYFLSVGFK
jgi:hypothetical protein